ncbi:MAG: single-stranded-DNA-specific exonuclease RecJ [Eggerthellaceae bacterium]
MSARINVAAADPAVAESLAEKIDLPLFIATTLVARGIDTPEKAERFLHPNLEEEWLDPYTLEGMDAAVDRIEEAIRDGQHILVYGDFDLDGVSATTLMTRGLRSLGATVTPFIPLRFEEGYGLSDASIKRVESYEPALVITVDNGIAAKREVALLQEAGIDVVITDHHELADLVPVGVPVVDPKRSDNPNTILAGAGVALKVTQAVASRFGKPRLWRDLIDLATLGTVADLMPMRDQNRALVSEGLRMINENPRPYIAALLGQSGFADKPVTSSNLSFTLVPRLNAAGRMGNAQLALDLLLCDDFADACHLASELEETNTRRRTIELELAEVASAQAEEIYKGQRALVVAGEGWHEGVKGIVASRLANRYGVPTLLFTIDGDEAHGSGRSVGEVNLFEAVSHCQDLLVRFGGHHAAVGVTIKADKLPEFTERLCAYMDKLPAEDFTARIEVDATVDLGELTIANVEKLDLLAPFGQENPSPYFLAHGVMMAGGRAVGADKNHLSCTLSDGSHSLSCIMFHCSNVSALLHCGVAMDAVFELQIDTWKGRRSVKAVVSSLKPLAPCAALEQCLEDDDKNFVSGLVASGDEEDREDSLDSWKTPESDRMMWEERATQNPVGFRSDLIQAFLGEGQLHASQQQALDLLDEGKNVLTIMGTGRGKSLIFYIHAAELALGHNKTSVFVYPLRALVADQEFHLQRTLGSFGLQIRMLTGASSVEERAAIMDELVNGEVDIILTTPEYLDFHASELAQVASFGFAVIDEAHHVGISKAGFRPSYQRLGDALERLGNPQVLALTATANEGVSDEVKSALHIDEVVIDETERSNLMVVDQRNNKKRERYVTSLVAQGEKTLIYVNSRMETVTLVRLLRKQAPHIASMIGFYNAGLSRSERERVEELFREGGLQVLVATSAFGEGIDIPGVRHVVLYHLPFSEVEFNQMSGRAGRDGNEATIHLLFGKHDVDLNASILLETAPSHDGMAQIYRALRGEQRVHGEGFFTLDADDLAQKATRLLGDTITPTQVRTGVAVFAELGLLQTGTSDNTSLSVYVVDYKGKVELSDSVRYREGLDEYDSFIAFKDWALSGTVEQLQDRIRRPLLP